MKPLNLCCITATLLFAFSCESTTNATINTKVEKVSINSSEVFEYQTGISGDEELATITLQSDHHAISKIVRDSTTNWQAVYRYKPGSGFEGKDQTQIKLGTGSDGASPNTTFEVITFEFTVQ